MAEEVLKIKKRSLAEESLKTKRARDKLKKKLEAIDQQITPEALKEKTIEIHRWIERHHSDRAVLKSKEIALFDGNQNTAQVSKKVIEIAEQLKKDLNLSSLGRASLQKSKNVLKGMIASQEKALIE
jgi:hypothetical protein